MAWGFSPAGADCRCCISSLDVRGRQGVFPLAAVQISSPFVIQYSQQTKKLKFSFAFFPFNASGIYQDHCTNFFFLEASQARPSQPPSTSEEKDETMGEVASEVSSNN
jgi:hypothetical protein